MKKTLFFLAIIAICLMLFTVGCGTKEDTSAPSTVAGKFAGGNTGLDISFVEGTPPDSVADQEQPFGISVKIENKGDHDIENTADATVSLTGIDPSDFGVSAADLVQDVPEQMFGASVDAAGNPVGGTIVTLDFPAGGGSFLHQEAIAGQVTYNVRAEVCYDYGTIANTKLCILKDILGKTRREAGLCEITESKSVDSSGGPVKVTSFKESVASSNKVAFVFNVEHSGQAGSVHEQGSECDDTYQMRNKVHVLIDTGVDGSLTCSGLQNGVASGSTYEGDIILLNNAREVRCTQTINNPQDQEKLVRIDLAYDYKEHADTQLKVEHFGE